MLPCMVIPLAHRRDNGKTPTGGSYIQVSRSERSEEDGPKSPCSTGPPREVLKQSKVDIIWGSISPLDFAESVEPPRSQLSIECTPKLCKEVFTSLVSPLEPRDIGTIAVSTTERLIRCSSAQFFVSRRIAKGLEPVDQRPCSIPQIARPRP
jgi:hypothetical protein